MLSIFSLNKLASSESVNIIGNDSVFDQFSNRLILLEESMIFGRRCDLSEAAWLFNSYCQTVLAEYNHDLVYGTQSYLKKGEHIVYHNAKTNKNETIYVTKNEYVTIYGADKNHLTYLVDLA